MTINTPAIRLRTAFFLLLCLPLRGLAEKKDITKFLGIPIDGSRVEMIRRLQEKGFTYCKDGEEEFMLGEFNGETSKVYIIMNRNRVRRIGVTDVARRDEQEIRERHNTLYAQFRNNPRYVCREGLFSASAQKIIGCRDRLVRCGIDTAAIRKAISDIQAAGGGAASLREEISDRTPLDGRGCERTFYQKPADGSYDVLPSINADSLCRNALADAALPPEARNYRFCRSVADGIRKMEADLDTRCAARKVWFRLAEDGHGRYYISIFYDNPLNEPHGEDL